MLKEPTSVNFSVFLCTMKLIFRAAVLDDLPKIVAIYNTTIPGRMVTADLEPVSVESRLAWFRRHQPDRRPLWMVEDETGAIVGWASFQDFYGRAAYQATAEISIYLDEAFRGKGVGRQILEHSIKACPQLGINTLLGYIFAHNEPSLKLFYALGFEDWGHLPNVARLDGVERSLKILGKRVDGRKESSEL